ncbi:restriction endonuclease subunit S [Nitrosomonas communis]|uniref:restriction endonuclease subunit S n=1 Tax=Nitrosomonas communis TaxID=44574 RepID=UPI003D26F577
MTVEFNESLPKSWQVCRLDEVATIIDSLHKTPIYTENGHAMVRVTDVQGGFLDVSKTLRVTEEVFQEFTRRYAPKRGDIVFSRVGSYGNASYANTDMPFCLGQNTALISPRINGRFLHFFLQSPDARRQIEQAVVGSTQKTISLKNISALQVPVPPVEELEAIAHILGTLDDKIELNRRMNETLEAIARAIFKSWFVDFDPVRAKASGEPPESICRRLRLTPDLLALFPDRLVDSQLGEIPEGWEVRGLDTIALLSTASTSPSKQPHEVFEHYSIPAFDFGTMPAYELGSTIKSNKYVVSPNAVLVSKLNPETPRVWLPAVKTERAICSTEFMQFVPLLDYGRSYLYLMMCSEPMQVEILKRVTGSTGSRQRAQPSQITTLPIVVPAEKVVRSFESLVTPVLVDTVANLDQSQTLASLRDTLLPKLLSGELHVNHLNNILEEEIA